MSRASILVELTGLLLELETLVHSEGLESGAGRERACILLGQIADPTYQLIVGTAPDTRQWMERLTAEVAAHFNSKAVIL